MGDREFDDTQIEKALRVLSNWNAKSQLKLEDSERIRELVREQELVCVPIWGAAAIFHVSVVTARDYEAKGIMEHVDVYKGNLHIFGVSDLEGRYARLRTERRTKTLVEIGKLFRS